MNMVPGRSHVGSWWKLPSSPTRPKWKRGKKGTVPSLKTVTAPTRVEGVACTRETS